MHQFLSDFTPASLVRANRANLYELFRYFESSPNMEFTQHDGLTRWSCSFQYAWFNAVLCARDARPEDAAFIDESLTYFRNKHTSDMCWWLEDGVDQRSWEALLIPRGFKLTDGPPGMSVDLDKLKGPDSLPAGVEIKVVGDEQGIRDCAEALVKGYGFPPDWMQATIDFSAGLGLDGPYRSYVAYLGGKPVSTAGVFFGKEVAGIYSVATVPEARGQGIGAAVTLLPLLEARKLGYRIGTLQASEMGLPVYKKMGFEQNFNVGSFYYTF